MPTTETVGDENLKRILDRAKKDAGFFHSLVFEPSKAVQELGFLSDEEKKRITALDPATVIGGILTKADCGVTVQCTVTCAHTSSRQDLNAGTLVQDCGVTVNCGSTCTHTVSTPADRFTDLERQIGAQLKGQIR
jgi:hypothetical protein